MAREALTVIGTIIGAFYGNPQLGYAIGAFVGGIVDPEQINAPSIGDIATQTSAEGVPCPLLAGTAGCAGNLIYASDPRVVKGKFRSGKGGPEVQDPDRVYRTFAIRIGASLFDGPGNRVGVTGLRKIWEDEKLVYDVSPGSTILAESAKFASGFTFYQGTQTQMPDPDIEAIKGVGNVGAYRGRCYIVFKNKDVTDRRGSISQYRFEVTVDGASYSPVTLATDVSSYKGSPASMSLGADVGAAASVSVARLSPSGTYLAVAGPTGALLRKYDATTETWVDLGALPGLGASEVLALAWSPDNQYLAAGISVAPTIVLWRRTGDTLTKMPDPAEFPPGSGEASFRGLAWDTPGQRLAFSTNNSLASVYQYDFVGGVLSNLVTLASPGTNFIGGSPRRLSYMAGAGSRYIICGNAVNCFLVRCDESPMTVAAVSAADSQVGVFEDASGGYAVAVGNGKVSIFEIVESTIGAEQLNLESTYTVGIPGTGLDSGISADRRFLAIAALSSQQYPTIVSLSNATPPVCGAVANPPSTGEDVQSVSWTGAPVIAQLEAGTTTFEQVTLAAGRRCKMPNSAWSIANQATKIVRGSVVASQNYTAQDYINSLRLVFPCDGAAYDGLIHLPSRGGPVVRELDEQFMVWEEEDLEQDETLRNGDDKRTAPIRRPLKINLMFPNANVGYQLTKASSPNYGDRGDAVNESTLEIPIVLDEQTEAPQLADILDKISRADAEGEIVRIFPENLAADLVPGSVVRLSGEGELTRRLRVESSRVGDCTKRLVMRVDRVHANTSQLTAQPGPAWPTPPPSLPGETRFEVMNLPALLDEHDSLGVYFALSGQPGTAWQGAFVDYRVQGSTNWIPLGLFTRRAIMGALAAPLSAASEFYPDTTNVLSMVPVDTDDQIESLTDAEWLSEGNPAAIVYPDRTAEVIQIRDAAQGLDGVWSLSHLQRGRLATTPGQHDSGASLVMLEGATFVPLPSSLIGQVIEFRVTTAGESAELADVYVMDWTPALIQTEFPIADIALTTDGTDITASWAPRHRFGTEDNPIASANLLGYRVEASDGITTKTPELATGTSRSFSESFFSSPGTVTVTVWPVNRFTGLGPSISGTIDI